VSRNFVNHRVLAGGWVHRLNRGVVESGAGAGAANETCRGRAIGKSRLSSVSLCDSVSVKTLTAVITRRTIPCCSSPCYQKMGFVFIHLITYLRKST
jgi:hypothetical protein